MLKTAGRVFLVVFSRRESHVISKAVVGNGWKMSFSKRY